MLRVMNNNTIVYNCIQLITKLVFEYLFCRAPRLPTLRDQGTTCIT